MPPSKRERTRAHVLHTALELFEQVGYDETSMSAVAESAGVVRQTVLNHFPRKEDFVLAWGAQRRDRLAAVRRTGPEAAGGLAMLHAVYRDLAAVNEAERGLTVALHRHYEAIARVRVVPGSVTQALEVARDEGDLDTAVDLRSAGQVLTAVYFDTLSRWLDSDDPQPLAEALRERVDLVLRGLLPRDDSAADDDDQ